MRSYSANDIRTVAAWMRDAAAHLEAFGIGVLNASVPITGFSGGGEPVAGGDISDPTAGAATSAVASSAWLEREQAIFRADIGHALDVSQALVERAGRVRAHFRPERDYSHTEADDVCVQDLCPDRRAPGRQGNCAACAQWLARNTHFDGTRRDTVPADVVRRRLELRAERARKAEEQEVPA
jgi:hypothetical protein